VSSINKIALVGDAFGIEQLLRYIPHEKIKCIIAASIRPQYMSELEKKAGNLGVPLLKQPKNSTPEYGLFTEEFGRLNIDLLMSNSYSMIIREDILKSIDYNAVNIHWALLPKNRGPNPIQWAIIKGEDKTGVTIHYMDSGIDSGDVISQKEVGIESKDTWVDLKEKLVEASGSLIEKTIPEILAGRNSRYSQNESDATVNLRLTPEYLKIDLKRMSDTEIYNLIRAQVRPLKGAYVETKGGRVYFRDFVEFSETRQLREKYGDFDKENTAFL
jgi:UDP-4-amino-4-deoxy-L-arabinose formyltransferase/UDP-glucuronic acid dehydrogenase (UDP-4-keto-hexauronic acid decarboxylating)